MLVGKAAMHELAFGITSNNAAMGAVKNPHDISRIPGGSSGGTAAAITTGIVPFGLGTDTGGYSLGNWNRSCLLIAPAISAMARLRALPCNSITSQARIRVPLGSCGEWARTRAGHSTPTMWVLSSVPAVAYSGLSKAKASDFFMV